MIWKKQGAQKGAESARVEARLDELDPRLDQLQAERVLSSRLDRVQQALDRRLDRLEAKLDALWRECVAERVEWEWFKRELKRLGERVAELEQICCG